MIEIYHILNRGVDKRNIFLDEEDYIRFIHDLYEFNDEEPVKNVCRSFSNGKSFYDINEKKKRKRIVDLLAFVLMPNHFHLMLIPRIENGVYLYMKKLGCGYARYFNDKYGRSGALFERRYKRILIKNEEHFKHLPYYIHCNPLDLIYPEWRKRKLKNFNKVLKFLDSYRWSSHLDYCGKNNFPSVTQRKFLLDYFDGENGYKENIKNWLQSFDIENFEQITLE
jgi:putative transposase